MSNRMDDAEVAGSTRLGSIGPSGGLRTDRPKQGRALPGYALLVTLRIVRKNAADRTLRSS